MFPLIMAPARIDSKASLYATDSPKIDSKIKVGINGFGRIGRVVFRASLTRSDLLVVAINHTCASISDVIHQICFDSTHGGLSKDDIKAIFAIDEHTLSVHGHLVHLFSERDPSNIDWTSSGAEYVIESTGKFTSIDLASAHLQAGAKRVLISAPSKDAPTFVFGVNHRDYGNWPSDSKPEVISCASCTTNCLAPMAKVLDGEFGIVQGLMTTVHASTRSQHVLDGYSKRDRRAGGRCWGM
jgi:glyceraldehyde 3-phosphate dehydrogenase